MTQTRSGWHVYEPHAGHGLAHDPLRAILGPRPIGWISSRSEAGIRNIAPYSFFSMLCDRPPILGFSSIGAKDTLANIRDTGVFAYNLVTRRHVGAMNETSRTTASEWDEFDAAGMRAVDCQLIECPRVADAPVTMECQLTQIVPIADARGRAEDAWLVLGEIVGVHIDTAHVVDGRFDTANAEIVQRAGYADAYFQVLPKGAFALRRPAEQ